MAFSRFHTVSSLKRTTKRHIDKGLGCVFANRPEGLVHVCYAASQIAYSVDGNVYAFFKVRKWNKDI